MPDNERFSLQASYEIPVDLDDILDDDETGSENENEEGRFLRKTERPTLEIGNTFCIPEYPLLALQRLHAGDANGTAPEG